MASKIFMAILRIVRDFIVIIIVLAVSFYFIAMNSVVDSRYKCSGNTLLDGDPVPTEIFMTRHKYRWWVGLWSDSDGSLYTESPNVDVNYYHHLTKSGNVWQIMDNKNGFVGYFLRNTLALNTVRGFFEGHCVPID